MEADDDATKQVELKQGYYVIGRDENGINVAWELPADKARYDSFGEADKERNNLLEMYMEDDVEFDVLRVD